MMAVRGVLSSCAKLAMNSSRLSAASSSSFISPSSSSVRCCFFAASLAVRACARAEKSATSQPPAGEAVSRNNA